MLFLNFLDCLPFTDLTRRDFYTRRETERQRERKREKVQRLKREQISAKERRETDSVLFCGGL